MKRKGRRLDDMADVDVVKACEMNYIDYWRCAGASPHAEFIDDEGVTGCITGVPQEIFNVVLRARLNPATIDRRIDNVIARFRSRRLAMIWHVGELSHPSDIGARLEARGFPHDYDLSAMAIDLDSTNDSNHPSEDVSVRAVVTASECGQWIDCLRDSWESPPQLASWMANNPCFNVAVEPPAFGSLPRTMYLGFYGGKPVSTAMLLWSDEIAGIQTVGTVGSARHRGAGAAVVGAALKDAKKMGFRSAVVLSTVEGVSLYKRLGFTIFGKLPEHSMDFRLTKS